MKTYIKLVCDDDFIGCHNIAKTLSKYGFMITYHQKVPHFYDNKYTHFICYIDEVYKYKNILRYLKNIENNVDYLNWKLIKSDGQMFNINELETGIIYNKNFSDIIIHFN